MVARTPASIAAHRAMARRDEESRKYSDEASLANALQAQTGCTRTAALIEAARLLKDD